MIKIVTKLFQEKFGNFPSYIVRAPGRVNLLGEYVDYNNGFVLPAAIDRATYLAFAPWKTDVSTLFAADFNQRAIFSPETLAAKTQVDTSSLPDWAYYPAGVLWSLREAGLSTPPLNALFLSDVPRSAGLSSSASVETAFVLAWQTLGGWLRSPMECAKLGQKAENKYVGVNCGIMDQFASACGVENHVLILDCRSLDFHTLPFPENIALVLANTKVERKLTGGEYNLRRNACAEPVRTLQESLPDIQALRDVSLEDFNRLAEKLPAELEKRARHVVEEIARTNRAQLNLQSGDIQGFGQLMNEWRISLRDSYEVSIRELDVLVEIAQNLKGCYGARLTGAGFGGCTVNLVKRDHADEFVRTLRKAYQDKWGYQAEIYICKASDGAKLL